MTFTTAPDHIKSSRKAHLCDWCGEMIGIGESYSRYRFYDGGDADTVKLHPECFDAMVDADLAMDETFMPGDNPRGCNCGFSADCDKHHSD